MAELTDDELLAELGVEVEAPKTGKYTPREERIIAGFEDILRFVEKNHRAPLHGEHRNIFERIYAIRLDRIRMLPEAKALLENMDTYGLLAENDAINIPEPNMDDSELLAELGVNSSDDDNINVLRHVSSREERRAAEDIANRTVCKDFEIFKPLFDQVEQALQLNTRETRKFAGDINIAQGDFFIVGGQLAYVAEKDAEFKDVHGAIDAKLRVVYSNGTESDLLMRSLQRALYRDDAGRRIVDATVPNLFSAEWADEDVESGTIYVLRSQSDNEFVAKHRELIHKLGVTGGKVEARISNAKLDPTYLMAGVETVATYKMSGINRSKLEHVLHRIFLPAQIDLTISDRFGNPIHPKEWFLVPLFVIDEAVERIRDGSIIHYEYDPSLAKLTKR